MKTKPYKLKLGDKVVARYKLVRENKGNQRGWKVQMLPKPIEVMIVGVRVLSNGYIDKHYYVPSVTIEYTSRETKKAYLVAPNLKQTFYIFAE